MKLNIKFLFFAPFLILISGCGTVATVAYGYDHYYSYGHYYNKGGHNYGRGDLEYNHYYEDLYGNPRTRVPYYKKRHYNYRSYRHYRENYRHFNRNGRCYSKRVSVWNHKYQRHVIINKRICR